MKLLNQKGLSLIELVMAMLMLSIVLLGTSSLESSVIRMQTGSMRHTEFQNNFAVAYRQLERDLNSSSRVMFDALPDPQNVTVPLYQWRIRPQDANPDGSEDISYTIDLRNNSRRFYRTLEGVTTDLLPAGSVSAGSITHPEVPNANVAMWISSDLKLITLNLQTDLQLALPVVASKRPGYARSFLLRTAEVMDCRSGTCI